MSQIEENQVAPVVDENAPSKAALKKAAKEAEKAQKKAEIAKKQAETQPVYVPPKLTLEQLKDAKFGDMPLHQSQPEFTSDNQFTDIKLLTPGPVKIRAYLHNVRATGKSAFTILRQRQFTLQAVFFGEKDMIKYINSVPKESYVEVEGIYKASEQPINSCSISGFELEITRFFAITRAVSMLPLQVEDAARPDSAFEVKDTIFVKPGRDTRFDNRILDLRTPANQSIFKVRMAIQQSFMKFLIEKNFMQITSPKIISGSSEGGADIFSLQYFGQPACLAQSPQLYKQMSIAAGFQRVFEIGPVFRAEKSHTHRHLCEFTGMDIEVEVFQHYHEVLVILDQLMKFIFKNTLETCKEEIDFIRKQFDLKMPPTIEWTEETVIVDFRDGAKWLQEAGYKQSEVEDLNTENERALGKIVKEKFHTDFYILDKFPGSIRPFYTMPDVDDNRFSNSYDMFIRGEEICSGAQRIHDPEYLKERIVAKGINPDTLKDYIDAFRYGCPPHAGAGLGLERIVMLMLGIEDCRQCCLFPRTPERLTP
ncbi:Aspartyl-tRNA_synthetase [Hexamita inflata]|uniref:aspartate--tRNA ligase n=1 Tax=Hexamita inflata TaxID=28002 RepID=A0ABP1HPE6_9EUKA